MRAHVSFDRLFVNTLMRAGIVDGRAFNLLEVAVADTEAGDVAAADELVDA